MQLAPDTPALAVWLITLYSIHVTTATVATIFLTLKQAPISLVEPTIIAWFVPLLGPLLAMIHTGRIRDWSEEEVEQWLYQQRMTEREAHAKANRATTACASANPNAPVTNVAVP